MVAAYAQLAAEGFVTPAPGAGTVVNAIPRAHASVRPAAEPETIRYDLRPGAPDMRLFPHAAWARAANGAMRSLPGADLGYGDPGGLDVLREALAEYLGRVRGVYCEPGDVMVCNGVSHGIGLVLRALAAQGQADVAVEDPGLPALREQIRRAGSTPVPVRVDNEGLRVADLAATAATAIIATPAHQYPTGVVLGPDRRRLLVDWARGASGYVIEDDYDAEYRYDRQPVGALQGVAPDRVIYCGSASKSLAPGLRLGWLVVPSELRAEIVAVRAATDRFTNVITQAAFAEFLRRGDLDRHLRRTRRCYRQRRDALDACRRPVPALRASHRDSWRPACGGHFPARNRRRRRRRRCRPARHHGLPP